jgi:hypothetical protein
MQMRVACGVWRGAATVEAIDLALLRRTRHAERHTWDY